MGQDESNVQVWPASDELEALGRVIQAASTFEYSLGVAFCALLGSKYGAVLISGKTSGQLIQDCKALVKAQHELDDSAKSAIDKVLNHCTSANERRNRLVHDMWALGPGAVSQRLQRQRSGYELSSRVITREEIDVAAGDLTSSSVELAEIILNYFGPERSSLVLQR